MGSEDNKYVEKILRDKNATTSSCNPNSNNSISKKPIFISNNAVSNSLNPIFNNPIFNDAVSNTVSNNAVFNNLMLYATYSSIFVIGTTTRFLRSSSIFIRTST